jgi:hypothetical protein
LLTCADLTQRLDRAERPTIERKRLARTLLWEVDREERMMTKNNLGIVVLGSLGLFGACGSSGAPVTTQTGCTVPSEPGCMIPVADESFVRWAGPVTDAGGGGSSSAVVTYTPGKLCMSGTVDSGANGAGWGAILAVGLVDIDATGTLIAPFDASALGVSQVRFTVEDPPLQGVLPQVVQITNAACTQISSSCLASFSLDAAVTDPGTVTARLTDFTQPDATHANTSLDQTLITSLQFYVPTLPGMAVPYDFCLRDLAFLGAAGQELRP